MLKMQYRLCDALKSAWTRYVKVAACEQHEIRTLIVKFVRRQKSSVKLIIYLPTRLHKYVDDRAHKALKLI
jgi:hypothetical protein